MNAIVLSCAEMGEDAYVAAGAVVRRGGSLYSSCGSAS